MHAAGITSTAVIVVGDVLAAEGFTDSYLYSAGGGGGAGTDAGAAARRHRRGPGSWPHALHPGVDVISSLAGRVPDPALPVGPVRIGGFGGVDGLGVAARPRASTPSSTPPIPFAATITAHAAEVCGELGCPTLCWPARPGIPVTPSS